MKYPPERKGRRDACFWGKTDEAYFRERVFTPLFLINSFCLEMIFCGEELISFG
jgi:hypothetical protein